SRKAVRQSPPAPKRNDKNGITRWPKGPDHALIGLAARMRLHIGKFAAEELLGPVNGQLLGYVNALAPAVIATPWIAFGVFVREHRSGGFEDGPRNDVLRGDQLYLVLLP